MDPLNRRIALRTVSGDRPMRPIDLENVALRLVSEGSTRWYEVSVEYGQHPHESYLFLSDISDLLQQEGLPFELAVESAISTFEEILARSRSLSREKQIGLFGELLFLASCVDATSIEDAVLAWKGYAPNEHDFVFPTGAFEIKSTTSESRRHHISGFDQLLPLPDCPLWLVSVQLTSATPSTGRTLAELVDDTRRLTADHPEFDRSLTVAGWRERDRSAYRTSYRLRSTPAAYKIDDMFPALTRSAIARGCPRPELIVDGAYTVDLTDLATGAPPSPADHFIGR
jgi:hypothetical protein